MTPPAAPKSPSSDAPETAPVIAIVDLKHDAIDLVVADTPERLWTYVQQAVSRRRAASDAVPPRRDGPKDFASAMRCVEREVYDLP